MKFQINITCDNAAFHNPDGEPDASYITSEVTRLLDVAKEKIEEGRTGGPLIDINGNTVGNYTFEAEVTSETLYAALLETCEGVGRTTGYTKELLQNVVESVVQS